FGVVSGVIGLLAFRLYSKNKRDAEALNRMRRQRDEEIQAMINDLLAKSIRKSEAYFEARKRYDEKYRKIRGNSSDSNIGFSVNQGEGGGTGDSTSTSNRT